MKAALFVAAIAAWSTICGMAMMCAFLWTVSRVGVWVALGIFVVGIPALCATVAYGAQKGPQ